MAKSKTTRLTTRGAIRHPYAGLLPGIPPAELDAIRAFIRERAWDMAASGPYEPSHDEADAEDHVAWTAALRERIKTIETCIRRGHHVTHRQEGKLLANNRSLVSMACTCGAHKRVIVPIDGTPPAEWT